MPVEQGGGALGRVRELEADAVAEQVREEERPVDLQVRGQGPEPAEMRTGGCVDPGGQDAKALPSRLPGGRELVAAADHRVGEAVGGAGELERDVRRVEESPLGTDGGGQGTPEHAVEEVVQDD